MSGKLDKAGTAAAAGEVAPSPEEVFEVFEFRITLRGIKPMIWRRIQVPKDDFTFEALHSAIQGAMGWHGFHLYNFRVRDQHGAFVQIADENGADEWLRTLVTILPADETNISDYFRVKGNYANYLYDFGDGWQHKVTLSKIVRGNPNESYPKVLAGKRACPPEDCGGTSGYAHLLQVVADPSHEEYEDLKSWLDDYDKDFDPEHFDPKEAGRFFF